jgi:DNA-binding transcriptional MocR family regulator
MNILDQIKEELPWLGNNEIYDLTRGKPSPNQLLLSQKLIESISQPFEMDGVDLRNYGTPEGIKSARNLGSTILDTDEKKTLALDNSSLTLMHQILACSYFLGFSSSKLTPESKFICLVPGYDRHFKLLENFGIEMISVPFLENGPDIEKIKEYIAKDNSIHGIVCVKENFMIIWDNAYACHDLKETIKQSSASSIARSNGVEENLFILGSTSKITLAGAGISFISSAAENLDQFISYRNSLTPAPNKMNQGLHAKIFSQVSIIDHMTELKKLILPKFELVESYLLNLKKMNLCEFTSPTGGYFFSFESSNKNAEEIINACGEVGLKLLPVGSCFPYLRDPNNSNIRLAPTFPNIEDLEKCMEIFSKVVIRLN